MRDCQIVGVCIFSGDGDWQVRGVDVEEKGCQDGSLCALNTYIIEVCRSFYLFYHVPIQSFNVIPKFLAPKFFSGYTPGRMFTVFVRSILF